MADTFDLWKEIETAVGSSEFVGDSHQFIQGMLKMHQILTEHYNKQLSDCWDEAYALGWSSGSNDSMDDDDKAKAAYLDKITNTSK